MRRVSHLLWPALLLPLLWPAPSQAGKRPPPRKGRLVARAEPALPLSLELLKIDLPASTAQVLVSGTSRAPDSRFFSFTDERRRRFVPSQVECRPQEGTGKGVRWACALEIPRIYQRSNLIGISFQLRGQTVQVAGDRVQTAWSEARSTTPLPASERPRDPGTPWPGARRSGDAPATQDPDDVDSEQE